MKLLSLSLQNFRGIKSLSINFEGKSANIYGANGIGKTTIANSISYLLTGQPLTNEKDFSPKTSDTHNLHHIVNGVFELDNGEQISLSKDYYEVYRQKKGELAEKLSGHTTDHYINGVPVKEKEYIANLEKICGGDVNKTKVLMLVGYFSEVLSTTDKRKLLFEVCDKGLSDETIINKNISLMPLNEYLIIPGTNNKYLIDEYKKIAVNQRREINKKLESIPERIDELELSLKNDLPTKDTINISIKNIEAEREVKQKELDILLSDSKALELSIDKKISVLENHYQESKANYIENNNKDNEEIYKAINALNNKKAELVQTSMEYKNKIYSLDLKINECISNRQRLLDEYDKVKANTFNEKWDENSELCSLCGQKLPLDKIEHLKIEFEKRREEHNKANSIAKEKINKEGQQFSKAIIDGLNKQKTEYSNKLDAINTEISDINNKINLAKDSVLKPKPFEETTIAESIKNRIERLNRDKENIDTNEALQSINKEIYELDKKLQDLKEQLIKINVDEKTRSRINELTNERKNKARELEYIDKGIYLCDEFSKIKARMITDNINKNFKTIKFALFKEQVNGGFKEICEPLIKNKAGQWVEYKSANTASQVNANLEIIDVLSNFYNLKLPVIVDRAESISNIEKISSQQINLIVSAEDKEFRIEQE